MVARVFTILVENQRVSAAGGRLLPICVARLANDYLSKSWVTVYLSSDYFFISNLCSAVPSF
uniref:Putative ovule protein n=1 Tax=Solanum chacoense TaxID=4108 RepID=A0A0V0HCV7_SOLCH